MKIYLLVATFVFLFLGIIWKKDDFLNTFIKLVLICLSIIGAFYWAELCGYIVSINN